MRDDESDDYQTYSKLAFGKLILMNLTDTFPERNVLSS